MPSTEENSHVKKNPSVAEHIQVKERCSGSFLLLCERLRNQTFGTAFPERLEAHKG